jgi:hypothetical protein
VIHGQLDGCAMFMVVGASRIHAPWPHQPKFTHEFTTIMLSWAFERNDMHDGGGETRLLNLVLQR